MSSNPYLNAVYASAYIMGVVLLMSRFVDGAADNTILMPITMLSLLVLSVSVMAFLFFYLPASMLLEGRRQEALAFFTRMLGTFAAITVLLLATVFILFM
jgi:hypothetical protein